MNQPSIASVSRPSCEAGPLWKRDAAARGGSSVKTTQRLCDVVTLATATAFAVPVGELIATSRRSAYVAFARQSAMYLAHVTFGLSYSEIAQCFGRDRTTAAHACQLIEDRRDDPGIDGVLALLENACHMLRSRLNAPVQP